MNKIFLIIQREYLSRVKKKSFLIMTLIGPLLMAGVMIVPVWLAMQGQEKQEIQVIDESFLFYDSIPQSKSIEFDYTTQKLDSALELLHKTNYTAILYIPPNILSGANAVKLFYKKQPGILTEEYVKNSLEKMIYEYKLQKNNINKEIIHNSQTSIKVITEKISENGVSEETNTSLFMFIGFGAGILIYLFIFMYGVQVMRGVMEEKTSRIVEVMLSSVKPFQLMMGKVVGVALVGLTQFLLWSVLTFGIYSFANATFLKSANEHYAMQMDMKEQIFKNGTNVDLHKFDQTKNANNKLLNVLDGMNRINFIEILLCFLFYFMGGYLLYSALFAAVGAAVDNEADTQQFMFPITLPLIFSFVMAQNIIQDPSSSLGFWLGQIPFTSPIIMMVRLPFGVPSWEIYSSMAFLVLGFLGTTWLASRIYRVGILMYGKKVSYKELAKWLFYKG